MGDGLVSSAWRSRIPRTLAGMLRFMYRKELQRRHQVRLVRSKNVVSEDATFLQLHHTRIFTDGDARRDARRVKASAVGSTRRPYSTFVGGNGHAASRGARAAVLLPIWGISTSHDRAKLR